MRMEMPEMKELPRPKKREAFTSFTDLGLTVQFYPFSWLFEAQGDFRVGAGYVAVGPLIISITF